MTVDRAAVRLIHVSDLHLDGQVTESGRRLRRGLGVRTHSYHLLKAGSEAVLRLQLDDCPAVLVATGDLTTAGKPTAFALAREIMEHSVAHADGKQHPVGLNAGISAHEIPGNHDRYSGSWIARQESAFENEFKGKLRTNNWEYYGLQSARPGSVYPKLPYLRVVKAGVATDELAVVLIGLDSTSLSLIQKYSSGRVAQGRVSDDSLRFVRNVGDMLRSNRTVMDSEGIVHDMSGTAVRIVALLHHHPYLPADQEQNGYTKLVNSDAVLEVCATAGVEAILYGHEHISFVDTMTFGSRGLNPKRIIFAAAGSLSVFGERHGNFFNVYDLSAGAFDYQRWVYADGQFRPDTAYRGSHRWGMHT
ncbi:MAG TPA: metallophosphoesterase [Gemmatimonadaceae bacterium]